MARRRSRSSRTETPYRGRVRFPDARGPDLVHAFTPREPVRRLTLDLVRRYGCPYVVHLEDNEVAVRSAITAAFDAQAIAAFLDGAAGMTVVVDRLVELKPGHVPGVVVWPGYDAWAHRGNLTTTGSRPSFLNFSFPDGRWSCHDPISVSIYKTASRRS